MTTDTRPDRRSAATGRVLLVVGAIASVLAIGLVATAFVRDADEPEVVLDVETVMAPTTPSTVPLIEEARPTPPPVKVTTPRASTSETSEPIAEVPDTTEPEPKPVTTSPLAAMLGDRGTAIPDAVARRVRPTSVLIDDIELWGPVRPIGIEDDGQLEIPDETEIGWYRYGASPGRPGATVLAAHVTWNRSVGPFHLLGRLEPGAAVDVALDDGSVRTYEVIERTIYDKDELPRERIWTNSGPETLVLITCGGDYNPDVRRYRQNIVVYAVPVASTQSTG